jgi:hypothetical protein
VQIDAELWDWSLVRITIGPQVSTHAVGLRMRDLEHEAGYVLTSPVRSIDRGARLLTTQHSVYELVHAVDENPADLLAHWIRLAVIRAKGLPDRIDLLKFDGSVARSFDQAEIVSTLGPQEIRDRVESVMAARGRARRRSKAGPSF